MLSLLILVALPPLSVSVGLIFSLILECRRAHGAPTVIRTSEGSWEMGHYWRMGVRDNFRVCSCCHEEQWVKDARWHPPLLPACPGPLVPDGRLFILGPPGSRLGPPVPPVVAKPPKAAPPRDSV